MKQPRLTLAEWRQVEALYHVLTAAHRDLFDALRGRPCGRALAPLARIDSKLGEVGVALENDAIRQVGEFAAPRFPRQPRPGA